jgi:hypothetical protein
MFIAYSIYLVVFIVVILLMANDKEKPKKQETDITTENHKQYIYSIDDFRSKLNWRYLTNDFIFLEEDWEDWGNKKTIYLVWQYSTIKSFDKFILEEHKKKLTRIASKIVYNDNFRQMYKPNGRINAISKHLVEIIDDLTTEDLKQIFIDLNDFYYPNFNGSWHYNIYPEIMRNIKTKPLHYFITYGSYCLEKSVDIEVSKENIKKKIEDLYQEAKKLADKLS